MNTEENEVVELDTVDQDTDTGADSEVNDSSTEGSDDFQEKYENQKKRAEKAEDRLKQLKSTLEDKDETEVSTESTEVKDVNNTNDSERMDRMELRQDGYADEVVDEIMKLGGKNALTNPILKRSADELQSEHNAQKATEISDGPQSQTKTKFSKEDLDNMSSDEMAKVLPHAED